jgi:cytochrome d ubiquinol oxidase subunit I
MGIYYINRLIARGAEGRAAEPPPAGTPMRPLASVAAARREIMGSRPQP